MTANLGIALSLAITLSAIGIVGCAGQAPVTAPEVTAKTPSEFLTGESLYNTSCAKCHGQRGAGTDEGPPMLDQTYAPNHHADGAFYLAVERGVNPHHWRFGRMPPIEGLSRDDVAEIIGYVRWLQQAAGIVRDPTHQ